jgi:hypothetical protein
MMPPILIFWTIAILLPSYSLLITFYAIRAANSSQNNLNPDATGSHMAVIQ